MSNQTAADWFVAHLKREGVEWIAALCGHGLDPLFDAARRAGVRIVDVRNEQTAGYIATVAGRLTRRVGVCATSSGVAQVNGLTGVFDAWFDHAPMLLVSGSANAATLGMGAFQDSPQVDLAAPVTKLSRVVDIPERAVEILDQALQAAVTTPPGPAHLMFPMDVQRTEVDESAVVAPRATASAVGVSSGALEQAARALLESKRPLLVAGSEVYYAGEGPDLVALAEGLSIPVTTPIWDRGVFDDPSEAFMGVCGSATGDPELLAQADCVVLAADCDYRVGYLAQSGRVHRVGRGFRELFERLVAMGASPWTEWLGEARRQRSAYRVGIEARAQEQRVDGRMHAVDVVRALEEAMPAEASLLIDGGSIGQWAHQLLTERRYPHYWLTCGRSGVVGWGLGGAMGARLAMPSRPVVLLSGDGSFTFTVAEIECAVRQGLHFVAVVADDQCWGITHSGHLKQFGQGIATELGAIDFAGLAAAMGARGVRVGSQEELVGAIREGLGQEAVTVIHARITGGNPVS